jgi:tetratricopeptide (TPR) repeat protein
MHSMKNTFQILIILFFSWYALASCSASKKLASSPESIRTADSAAFAAKRQNTALFSDGIKEKLAGNDVKAIAKFEQALKIYPEDHASMYELSELYARRARLDESLEMMKKAVALNPENEWYQIRIAQLYKFQGDYESYADVYRYLLRLKPGSVEYFSELSSALLLLEKYDEALKVYEEIEKQMGINEMLSFQKQAIHQSRNDTKNAIAEIEKLSAAFPWEARYHAILAELYMKYGPKEKALEQYQKILQIEPSDPYIRISLAEYYKDASENEKAFEELLLAFANPELDIETKVQIMVLWFEGETFTDDLNKKAERIAEIFQQVHPSSPRGFQLMADVFMRNKDFENARTNFLAALNLDKGVYLVWESLLFTDIQLEDFESLGKHAQEAMLLFPEQPLTYLFDGIAKFQLKDYAGALKSYETGRKFVVGNDRLLAEFFSNIGDTQHSLGNHPASDASYDKALAINPVNNLVLNNYAYYLSLRGENLEKALKMSEKAIELEPENPSYLDTYAWILYKMGDYEKALIWIEKSIQFAEPANGTLLEHYGDILYKLGRKAEASEQWKKARTAGETSDLIDKKIKDGVLYE